ncbi:osmotin-like protein, partial [Triticum aestivum]|uniref:osmotin-like protein n=1 Tax=Triticum aestivum TaxID=4565 RepID=UPI001D00DD6D
SSSSSLPHRSFPAPTHAWSGRIWARTSCVPTGGAGQLCCATGDYGGWLHCGGLGGVAPATLARVSLHHGGDNQSSYGVSIVDGFNMGMSVTPHEGRGNCPVLACRKDLTQTCPGELQVRAAAGGGVAACKSGCLAFGTDELCCHNAYNSPAACRPSKYSDFFKSECPQAFTYAHDNPSLTHQCSASCELKVIFYH